MRKYIYILSLLIIFNSTPGSSQKDGLVSRTSGVAPLAVHFFADFVDSVSGDKRIDRFHHYDYTWNFSDPGSGNWGTTGKSKNIAKGPVAVHIFQDPGNYKVTLTIRNHTGVVGTKNYTISVSDPNSFYSGTKTTCVNNKGDTDFSSAPAGARKINTNALSTIVKYAKGGSRILLKRGASWTSAGLNWPNNTGPVTIGAYGTGTNPSTQGIYANAPRITVTSGTFLHMEHKKDWRIMDLHLRDSTRKYFSISGAASMQRQLFLRLKIEGFSSGLLWAHWNDSRRMPKDDMVVASCNISDSGSNVMYVGSQRLALLGNILRNAQKSHVLRVWQAYRSVISHNILSGSSIKSGTGRHALKLHGPGNHSTYNNFGKPVPGTDIMDARTEYVIISDNIFGSSGPWPVAIGPQNAQYDERLSHIIFERNRFHSDYGTQSSSLVQVALHLWARYCTIRNNIFDGTGSSKYYSAIVVEKHATEPAPTKIEIYNNTIYRGDRSTSSHTGIVIGKKVTNSIVKNNLVCFPYATRSVKLLDNQSSDLVISNNLLTRKARFTRPRAANPLDRHFTLQANSPALRKGTIVPVYENYLMKPHPKSSCNLGAF